MRSNQQGSSLLLVLVTLALLLVGASSLMRVSATSAAQASNVALKDASRQATEVALRQAFIDLVALADKEKDSKGYFALERADLTARVATAEKAWDAAPEVTVGNFTVRYLVERLCSGTLPVSNPAWQCFLQSGAAEGSARANVEAVAAPPSVHYRITVRAEGPRGTDTWVQSLVNL